MSLEMYGEDAMSDDPLIVIAGHTCLDIIPTLTGEASRLSDVLAPGGLRLAGPMVLATGGAAPNTGLALHRLGARVRLVGKVGEDALGQVTLAHIRRHGEGLDGAMIVAPEADSAYTVILSSTGIDRTFIHYPGPNATFCAGDVPDSALNGASLFHFGYPSLMRQMYLEDGAEMAALFRRAWRQGLVTSLDVSQPDPESEAGRSDWQALLKHVLPHVDLFLPSVEEAVWMVDRQQYAELAAVAGDAPLSSRVTGKRLGELADWLLQAGAAVVGLKLGDQGMYLRTTDDRERIDRLSAALSLDNRAWRNRELLAPAFQARLVGTTGAGDCAVAGFLTGLAKGLTPEDALTAAVAVGACNIEAADAVSGVPAWEDVQQRIAAGWAQVPTGLRLRGWGWDVGRRLWIGPWDRGGLIAQSAAV